MANSSIEWTGKSGRKYLYYIFSIGTTFDPYLGNYIFAKETEPSRFQPIYIGQTENLAERFDNHHKMQCIKRNEATHIHAHKNSRGEAARRAEETDLIQEWNPVCND